VKDSFTFIFAIFHLQLALIQRDRGEGCTNPPLRGGDEGDDACRGDAPPGLSPRLTQTPTPPGSPVSVKIAMRDWTGRYT
jgi:hypothetical protein